MRLGSPDPDVLTPSCIFIKLHLIFGNYFDSRHIYHVSHRTYLTIKPLDTNPALDIRGANSMPHIVVAGTGRPV